MNTTSYEQSAKKYEDLQTAIYDEDSIAYKQLDQSKKINEWKKIMNGKGEKEIYSLLQNSTKIGNSLDQNIGLLNFDSFQEALSENDSIAYLNKKLKNLYEYEEKQKKNYNYIINKKNKEEYNLQYLAKKTEKIKNILGRMLEKGNIILEEKDGKEFNIIKIAGIETIGDNINTPEEVLGFDREVKIGKEDENHFNHHPVFIFEDKEGKTIKITYHELITMSAK